MTNNHKQTNSGRMQDEALPDIPEVSDHDSPGGELASRRNTSQQLSSENVARWNEQGGDPNIVLEKRHKPKLRKKIPHGPDHIKHRRTRSGCYTCRSRRVKCDETRPICERCRKGPRECLWPPEPAGKSGLPSKGGKLAEPEIESSGDEEVMEEDNDDNAGKDVADASSSIIKQSVPTGTKQKTLSSIKRAGSTVEQIKDNSMSPSGTDETRADSDHYSLTGRHSIVSTNTSHDDILWSQLKNDHQFYLKYHQESLNYCHYLLKHDLYNFIGTTLIETAMTYEPLLYAVVGFSAFRYAMSVPDQQISNFLSYYNKAMLLLRQSISRGEPYTNAMIYTVLQLATFEEYMGDWPNLMNHQQAACQMITAIYTPESIMQSGSSRTLFSWYVRFDTFVSYMANSPGFIGHEWLDASRDKVDMLHKIHPESEQYMMEALLAEQRLLGRQLSDLPAKLAIGEITMDDFLQHNQMLLHRVKKWTGCVRSLRTTHSQHLVRNFSNKRPLTEDDIVDPFEAGVIFDSTSFMFNFLLLDCFSLELAYNLQTSSVLRQPPLSDLTNLSRQQYQIFAAMEEYEGAPNGCLMSAQIVISVACFFAPKDQKHITWCRKRMADFENSGYIYPSSLRVKAAENWSMPSIKESWLPPEIPQPRIVRELRSFVADRTTKPQSQVSADVRSMRAVFEKLQVDEKGKGHANAA